MLTLEDWISNSRNHPIYKLNKTELLELGKKVINEETTHCLHCGTEITNCGQRANTGYTLWDLDGAHNYELDDRIVQLLYECKKCNISIRIVTIHNEIMDVKIYTKG